MPVQLMCLCLALGIVLNQGCRSELAMDPKKEQKSGEYVEIATGESLAGFLGRKIVLKAIVSKIPWQHLISIPDTHPNISYLDLSDGGQLVAYSKDTIACSGKLEVWGEVIEVGGGSKRPGSDEHFVEHQLLVDRWECDREGPPQELL